MESSPLVLMPKLVFGTVQTNLKSNIKRAIELGYTHIDCADGYTGSYSNRRIYFDILRVAFKLIPRRNLWITWKSDIITIDNIRSIIELLDCSYLDLFLIHHFCGSEADFEVFKQAVELKLIRYYGVSNCENIDTITDLKTRHNIYANQIQARSPNGIVDGRDRYDFFDFVKKCNNLGVAIMLFSSVSGFTGMLGNTENYSLLDKASELIPLINPYYMHKYLFNLPIPIPDTEIQTLTLTKLLRYILNLRFDDYIPNALIVSSASLPNSDSTSLKENMDNFIKISRGEYLLTYSKFIQIEDILEQERLAHM